MLKSEHIPLKGDININICSHTKGKSSCNLNNSVLCWFNIIMEKTWVWLSFNILCTHLFRFIDPEIGALKYQSFMPSIWLIWGFIKTHFISKHSLMQERSVQSQAVLFLLYHVFCKDNSVKHLKSKDDFCITHFWLVGLQCFYLLIFTIFLWNFGYSQHRLKWNLQNVYKTSFMHILKV